MCSSDLGGKFKSARSFFWLCCLHTKTCINHCCNFFETGHGKVEHDGAGACIKQALQRYQMNPYARRLVDAKEVVQWCIATLSHETNQPREVQRYIHFNFYWISNFKECTFITNLLSLIVF